jgi:hypothetical protein
LDPLKEAGHALHLCRIENEAGEGNPDVEGCIDGRLVQIELKSCARPARAETLIRPKTRESQSIWHGLRTKAGCRFHWILIQVGEAHKARLYLIPGCHYDEITAPEHHLELLSVCDPTATPREILLRSAMGW